MNDTHSNPERIAGSVWLSSLMIGVYTWTVGMCLILHYSNQKIFSGVFMIVLAILFFMRDSMKTYYFLFAEDHMTIKNHFITWEAEDVYYNEIAELRIDKSYRLPNQLTIVKTYGVTNSYPADTLSTKHWNRLSQIVAEKGIKLVDNASVLH